MSDQTWRLHNLYWIKNPEGKRVLFQPNWAQQELFNDPHPCKIVLKARQLGITTAFCVYALDQVLFNRNVQAGIIAQTLEDAQKIFQDKLKFTFDHLDPRLRAEFRIVGDSARELAFSNGSCIRVGTSLRGSTLQLLHVSEFGKICAKYPERAREVISGSLNTVHKGQYVFIESTAEGKEGHFFSMCEQSRKLKDNNAELSPLDFSFHFFPWWKHPDYAMDTRQTLTDADKEYFAKLELNDIKLLDSQKWWYIAKKQIQQDDMTREYPSTPDEAFSASQEGYWYATQMRDLHAAEHITNVSYDKALPVHTAWDLGQADMMSIWFFQITRSGEINLIDYFQKSDCPIDMIASILKAKGYTYGTHIWPHDANARDRAGITFVQQSRAFGLTGIIIEQHSLRDGINLVRSTLSKCWFDAKKCHEGIVCLENYKKTWSNSLGGWNDTPSHDSASHGADSFRYLCSGLSKIKDSGQGGWDEHYKALRGYFG